MSHTESYIDFSVKTPENLPSNIVALLDILSDCDRKLSSSKDTVGNKRDLAGTLYCAISEKPRWRANWTLKDEIVSDTKTETTNLTEQ